MLINKFFYIFIFKAVEKKPTKKLKKFMKPGSKKMRM